MKCASLQFGLRIPLSNRARIGVFAAALCIGPLAFAANFSSTGSLATARNGHTATLLPNGMVLVAGGGGNSGLLASAELYNPATGTWSATGNLVTARDGHTATLLPNGMVLVAGGYGISNSYLASAELYNPATGTWSTTGNLATGRNSHTATLLPNGMVLVAGGENSGTGNYLASTELYNPATGTWISTGNLSTARGLHTATLLPNGMVLVAAGNGNGFNPLASAELYNPATGTWIATGNLTTNVGELHTATPLPNGMVLVAGGVPNAVLAGAELYNPATGTWSATGNMAAARCEHTTTLLPNGMVLVAGGYNASNGNLASAELYNPTAGTWSATGNLTTARETHTATLLPNGMVLVAGGDNSSGVLASAELYSYAPTITSPLFIAGQAGASFSYQITATASPTSYSATNLPTTLTFNTSTGLITGTLPAGGSYSITIGATNSVGTSTATLALTTINDAVANVYPPIVQGNLYAQSGQALAIDSGGNRFIAGSFYGTLDFNPAVGVDAKVSSGGSDAFVTKYNANGTYAWTQTFGGSGNDVCTALALSPDGATVYATGYFSSGNAQIGGAGPAIGALGQDDAFVIALSAATGQPNTGFGLSSSGIQTFGGTGEEQAFGIATDSNSVYITGSYNGPAPGIGGATRHRGHEQQCRCFHPRA